MADHPVPVSAHPGVEKAYGDLSLRTLVQAEALASASWFPDISEFQSAVDWNALEAAYRAGTISGVAMRAGFGTVRADAQFATNQREARARGIPVIYYWFNYFAYNTPEAEATMMNATVGPLRPGEAMCGDFEDDPGALPFPRGAAGLDAARRFLTALQAPQNATWWYTYPFLLSSVGLQPLETTWPFWEADYSATPDSAFAPAIARQFTDCGSTPGVGSCCDQSRILRGPLAQWLTPGGPVTSSPSPQQIDQAEADVDLAYVVMTGHAAPSVADRENWANVALQQGHWPMVDGIAASVEAQAHLALQAKMTLDYQAGRLGGTATYVKHTHNTTMDGGTPS